MRVFLSAFSSFTLAVPMEAVASIMLCNHETEETVHYDKETMNTYISLPKLFNLPDEIVRHGIILRDDDSTANKVVLVSAEIKRDIDIPDRQFHPMPKALNTLRFSKMFGGILFSGNPILLLNVEHLVESVQERLPEPT
jgi:chemotaxis signal transduction protein